MSTFSASCPQVDSEGDRLAFIQEALLAWFDANGRDLPWRRTRDPYFVLVSEVMLQQIQVLRAIPFYEAFVACFPSVRALAGAPIAEVIRVWGDMGRYRRIGYLHRAAREIMERFGGVVPSAVADLRSLPGVGPYAAGAIACFAFEQDVAFVDTNVRRVLRRLFGSEMTPTERAVAELASRLVPPGRGWDWNQGLLDFGALHCTARRPRCETCPLASVCHARANPPVETAPAIEGPRRAPSINRRYRGRVLTVLREREEGAAVSLPDLGRAVDLGFADEDLSWLYGVVTSLACDGLASISEDAPGYDAEDGSPNLNGVTVRLP